LFKPFPLVGHAEEQSPVLRVQPWQPEPQPLPQQQQQRQQWQQQQPLQQQHGWSCQQGSVAALGQHATGFAQQGQTAVAQGLGLAGGLGPQNIGVAGQEPTGAEYVEWRRSLPWDYLEQRLSDNNTFLRVMKQVGLFIHQSDVKEAKNDGLELSLRRSAPHLGGCLTFYRTQQGKITIGQSNVEKKAAIWKVIAPVTEPCGDKPSKRRKKTSTQTQMPPQNFQVPHPMNFAMGWA